MTAKQKTLPQTQMPTSLRSTLDIHQNSTKIFQNTLKKSPERSYNGHNKHLGQNYKDINNSMNMLSQSHDLRLEMRNPVNQEEKIVSKSPWKINQLLRKNRSNQQLMVPMQTKMRLLSPPLLGNSLRNTLEYNSHTFKGNHNHKNQTNQKIQNIIKSQKYQKNQKCEKNQKKALLETHKKLFKKQKTSISQQDNQQLQTQHPEANSINIIISKSNQYKLKTIRNIRSNWFSQYKLCVEVDNCTIWGVRVIKKSYFKNNTNLIEEFIFGLKFQMWASHSNIIQIYDIFDDQECVYVVEEYMQSGSLKYYTENKLIKINEAEIGQRATQICSALEYIHQNKLYHGQLNPFDIMVTHETCKIGAIKKYVIQDQVYLCSRCLYMPPEVFRGRVYDMRSDLWCVGLILYEMCTGQALFSGQNPDINLKNLLQFNNTKLIIEGDPSPTLSSLIQSLLNPIPNKRINISQLNQNSMLDKNNFQKEWAETAILLGYDTFPSQRRGSKSIRQKKNDEFQSPSFLKKKNQISMENIHRVESKVQMEFVKNIGEVSLKFVKNQYRNLTPKKIVSKKT